MPASLPHCPDASRTWITWFSGQLSAACVWDHMHCTETTTWHILGLIRDKSIFTGLTGWLFFHCSTNITAWLGCVSPSDSGRNGHLKYACWRNILHLTSSRSTRMNLVRVPPSVQSCPCRERWSWGLLLSRHSKSLYLCKDSKNRSNSPKSHFLFNI